MCGQYWPSIINMENDSIQSDLSASHNWETYKCKRKSFGSKIIQRLPQGLLSMQIWALTCFCMIPESLCLFCYKSPLLRTNCPLGGIYPGRETPFWCFSTGKQISTCVCWITSQAGPETATGLQTLSHQVCWAFTETQHFKSLESMKRWQDITKKPTGFWASGNQKFPSVMGWIR